MNTSAGADPAILGRRPKWRTVVAHGGTLAASGDGLGTGDRFTITLPSASAST